MSTADGSMGQGMFVTLYPFFINHFPKIGFAIVET
jgi:hypothetical protein